MKFLTIEVENIFAYSGRTVLDVASTTPERNVVLVWGRNGMGKTSLLNSIKLLFLGAEDRTMREIGFPPKILGHRQYVLGDGAGWSGVINTRSRRDPDAQARVRLVWEESDGRRIAAERRWAPTAAGYRETLIVDDGDGRLTEAAAEERLADFLPRDFVRFFFFDGEDIKALAEQSEGRKAVDFDRVLRISFVSDLAVEVAQVAVDRQRKMLPAEVQTQIADVEGEIGRAKAVQHAAMQQIAGIEDRLVTKRSERRQLLARRDNLRSGASSADREALESRRDELKNILEQQEAEVNELIPPVAPMLANPSLVEATLQALDQRLAATGGSEQILIRRIQDQLPDWIHDGPPSLSRETEQQITETLRLRLAELIQVPESSGLFAQLDVSRAMRIRDVLMRFSKGEQRRTHAQLLQSARRTRLEFARVKDELIQIEVGSLATLEEYRRVTAELEGVDEQVSQLDQELGQQRTRRDEAQDLERRKTAELHELERTKIQVERYHGEALFVQHVARTLNDLREELRFSMRARVEALINDKFRILVHDNNLVHEVQLDDTYTLNFLDERGERVGRSSLSSGLKQLAATALLWAMKEVPGHEVPVVIDTPLGRIDRENQDNMLLNYYPHLAHQVLVFPTNAEIDHRKYELIRNRIAREYRIDNDTGNGATVRLGSLLN